MPETFVMRSYEVVCPTIDNKGNVVNYDFQFQQGLKLAGFEGWTEFDSMGYWQGKFERGRTFQIYSDTCRGGSDTLQLLCNIARKAMPDQKAIQVVDKGYITLVEA